MAPVVPAVAIVVDPPPTAPAALSPVDRPALEAEAINLRSLLGDAIRLQPDLSGGASVTRQGKRLIEINEILAASVHESERSLNSQQGSQVICVPLVTYGVNKSVPMHDLSLVHPRIPV